MNCTYYPPYNTVTKSSEWKHDLIPDIIDCSESVIVRNQTYALRSARHSWLALTVRGCVGLELCKVPAGVVRFVIQTTSYDFYPVTTIVQENRGINSKKS